MTTIREERVQAGLTQARLAELANVGQANLSAIESGRRSASAQMLSRLRLAMRRPSQALAEHRSDVLRTIEACGASNPRIFGSVARSTDEVGSDLDILVHVPPENAWRFVALRPALEELLGIKVDVISENGLSEKHDRVIGEAVPL